MTMFRAGFGRADVTPKVGCQLIGYGNRPSGSTGVHDPLSVRALVLEDGGGQWAVVSVEFLYVNANTAAEIREAVQRRVGIRPANVFIAATHTHSGPHDRHADNWDQPLPELFADAVEAGAHALQPAQLGSSYGMLYGYSINRRWLDRPVDPGVAVLRVDDADGNLLGLVSSFGCHAVVLGYDNFLISGDWPGYASTRLEETLGPDVTSMFLVGGAGDINPLVAGVRRQLASGRTIRAIGEVSSYYGPIDDPDAWNIGDRGGGAFEEVAELGEAFAGEALRVARRIQTKPPTQSLWSEQIVVNAKADADEVTGEVPALTASLVTEHPFIFDEETIPAEIMLLNVDDLILVGQPGEVFSQTAINLRTELRRFGYRTPVLVSYANGWLAYLPEPEAFDGGGYEPGWALRLGISRHFQPRVWEAIEPVLRARATDMKRKT